jgi:hypothetical protein
VFRAVVLDISDLRHLAFSSPEVEGTGSAGGPRKGPAHT